MKMVRYKVKPDRAAVVRAVYDGLLRTRPHGLRYGTFQLTDGVSFLHFAETEDGSDPLSTVQAFEEFRHGIADRCEEAPVVTELQYRAWLLSTD
jgi:hypothetical protein